MGEETIEEKKLRLKAEIYDLQREAERVQLSLQKIGQIIQGKRAEIDELEKVREIKEVKEKELPS